MPGEVQVKKASEIREASGPQSDGMIRIPAIVDMSDQVCGTGKLSTSILVILTHEISDGCKAS